MREVISRILEAEAEARRLRDQTAQESDFIRQNARREGAQIKVSAARAAAQQSAELLAGSLADARARHAEELSRIQRAITNELQCSDDTRQAWSHALARFLGGTP